MFWCFVEIWKEYFCKTILHNKENSLLLRFFFPTVCVIFPQTDYTIRRTNQSAWSLWILLLINVIISFWKFWQPYRDRDKWGGAVENHPVSCSTCWEKLLKNIHRIDSYNGSSGWPPSPNSTWFVSFTVGNLDSRITFVRSLGPLGLKLVLRGICGAFGRLTPSTGPTRQACG